MDKQTTEQETTQDTMQLPAEQTAETSFVSSSETTENQPIKKIGTESLEKKGEEIAMQVMGNVI